MIHDTRVVHEISDMWFLGHLIDFIKYNHMFQQISLSHRNCWIQIAKLLQLLDHFVK